MTQLPLTLEQARDDELGREGMRRGIATAQAHAERERPGWSDQAYDYLLAYAARGGQFVAPDVRRTFQGPPAPTAFAWGGVFRRAACAGKIVRRGTTTYGDATMHTQNVAVWEGAKA